MGPLPTFYQTNFKFNINETSEAKGIADHVTLLRLFFFSVQAGSEGLPADLSAGYEGFPPGPLT